MDINYVEHVCNTNIQFYRVAALIYIYCYMYNAIHMRVYVVGIQMCVMSYMSSSVYDVVRTPRILLVHVMQSVYFCYKRAFLNRDEYTTSIMTNSHMLVILPSITSSSIQICVWHWYLTAAKYYRMDMEDHGKSYQIYICTCVCCYIKANILAFSMDFSYRYCTHYIEIKCLVWCNNKPTIRLLDPFQQNQIIYRLE